MLSSAIQTVCVYAIPLLFAITMHEAAHGLVARLCGDNTAWSLGRVTLNPIPHIDPVGTLLVPGLLVLFNVLTGTSGVLFGWAKPVPVNPRYFRHYKRDTLLVALAGPMSNLLQSVLWMILLQVTIACGIREPFVIRMMAAGIACNLVLMAFNLIPIPPLDGGRVLSSLLPWKLSVQFDRLERYGMMIVLILLMTDGFSYLIRPFMMFGQWVLSLIGGPAVVNLGY